VDRVLIAAATGRIEGRLSRSGNIRMVDGDVDRPHLGDVEDG
jgi:hypothetical protein